MPGKARAPERSAFYATIIALAAEGGADLVSAHVSDWETQHGAYEYADIRFPDRNDAGHRILHFDHDALARAFSLVRHALANGETEGWGHTVMRAYATMDASLLDPVQAINLAEIAHFGHIYYT
jgi:hypothetical protein